METGCYFVAHSWTPNPPDSVSWVLQLWTTARPHLLNSSLAIRLRIFTICLTVIDKLNFFMGSPLGSEHEYFSSYFKITHKDNHIKCDVLNKLSQALLKNYLTDIWNNYLYNENTHIHTTFPRKEEQSQLWLTMQSSRATLYQAEFHLDAKGLQTALPHSGGQKLQFW